MDKLFDRRRFIAAAGAAGAATLLGPRLTLRGANATPGSLVFSKQSTRYPGRRLRVVVVGDSITAGTIGLGYWYGPLATTLSASQIAATGPASPPFGLFAANGVPSYAHDWVNSGVGGNDCTSLCGQPFNSATLTASIAARVTQYQPDVVLFGPFTINCMNNLYVGGHPTDAECTTNHPAMISEILSQNPGVQLLCIGPMCWGEQWPYGTNGRDTLIEAKNVIFKNAAASLNVMYLDIRPAFFTKEAIVNPSNFGSGIMTPDLIHPNSVGQTWLGQQVAPLCTFS